MVASAPLLRGVEVAFVHTDHLAELAAWFGDVIGLATRYEDDHWIEFACEDGSRFALDGTGFARSEVEAQPVVISFRVDDLAAAVATLSARGVAFYPDADRAIHDVGPTLVASFRDPRGTWYQLAQRKDG
jgi:predicted enzyme related to lactoylglutathione lyase